MEWLRSWPLKNFLAGVTLSICTSSCDAAAAADDDDDDAAAPLGLVVAVTVTSGCATSAAPAGPLVDDDFLLALPGPLPTTGDPA